YDLATGLWHQRGVWNPGAERWDPMHQWCHMFAFGKHLVGDRTTGTIYEQTSELATESGVPMRRQRRAPHVNNDQQWLFGSQVSIGVETGLALDTTAPVLDLSFSVDGGHVYSEPQTASLGGQRDYGRLVTWYRTPGRFHDLVLDVTTSAATPVRINSCQLRVDGGTGMR